MDTMTAYFRHQPTNDKFELVFNYVNTDAGIDRVFNLQRAVSETIDATFTRIRTNIAKELNKRGGKKKIFASNLKQGSDSTKIELVTGAVSRTFETWIEFIKFIELDTNEAILMINEQGYKITYNDPFVAHMSMPTVILVGYDCYPTRFEVVFGERDKCLYQWYRGLPIAGQKTDENIKWIECDNGNGFFYNANANDFQHKLKVNGAGKNH